MFIPVAIENEGKKKMIQYKCYGFHREKREDESYEAYLQAKKHMMYFQNQTDRILPFHPVSVINVVCCLKRQKVIPMQRN